MPSVIRLTLRASGSNGAYFPTFIFQVGQFIHAFDINCRLPASIAEVSLQPVMLWCGAVFAAEGYYEVAAGFEAKLVTHLLDGDGPVPEQIDAAVKQDVIEEARRALVGGGAEEAGKTNLAHTEQTAEMIQPKIVLAPPANKLRGAQKIMTG